MQIYRSGYETSHAIVIGINQYDHLPPLVAARQDAETIARTLKQDFDFENITTLFDRQATSEAILEAVEELANTSPNDRVFVYFAGHGVTRTTVNNEETGYLAVSTSKPGKYRTTLPIEHLLQETEYIPAKHIFFVFDACFSGLVFTRASASTNRYEADLTQRRCIQAIAAGQKDQAVNDLHKDGHSIFTSYLLRGLGGKAASKGDFLSGNLLGVYLQEQVGRHTRSLQTPQFGHLLGSQGGDFVFRESRKREVKAQIEYDFKGARPIHRFADQESSEQDVLVPQYTNSHAIIIGIDDYEHLHPLGNAVRDAEMVAKCLADLHGFNIQLIKDANATLDNILDALYKLRTTKMNDRILIYYAGNAMTLTDRVGREEAYLALCESDNRSLTWLALDHLLDSMNYWHAKHIMFVLDACFAGQALGMTRTPHKKLSSEESLLKHSYSIITSGSAGQSVTDMSGFADEFVRLLSTLEAGDVITGSELGMRLSEQVTGISKRMQIPQYGHLSGSQGGEMLFFGK